MKTVKVFAFVVSLFYCSSARAESPAVLIVDHKTHTLGQPVHLSVRLNNVTTTTLVASADVSDMVEVWLSEDGSNYRRYQAPLIGLSDKKGAQRVAPGASLIGRVTLLYNDAPPVNHLSEMARHNLERTRLLRPFAFEQAGVYWIKVVVRGFLRDQVESEPITVQLNMPTGIEADLWRLFEERPEYAYFLQSGEWPPSVSDIDASLSLLQQICDQPGTSEFVSHIRKLVNAELGRRQHAVGDLR